jgi:hypothetical protein
MIARLAYEAASVLSIATFGAAVLVISWGLA